MFAGAALGLALMVSLPATATPIPGLFNTGVDASGAALSGGNGVTDPHYRITSAINPSLIGQQAVTYTYPYFADDANSRWVSLGIDGGQSGAYSAVTTYSLTFDLTGFDALTASISGSYAADNSVRLLLNGTYTGNSFPGFSSYGSFTVSGGFQSGLNSLDFEVTDAGAPTAFRVANLTGSADVVRQSPPVGVPELASMALLLAGLGLAGVFTRRQGADLAA